MLLDILKISSDKVHSIQWSGDPLYYDLQLYQLGEGEEQFWVLNPEFEGKNLHHFIDRIPKTRKCVVFSYNGKWVAKLFKEGWYPYHGYETVEILIPKLVWTRNPDIDSRMTFDIDPRTEYSLDFWDLEYEMYWIIDHRFFPHEGDKWIYKASVLGRKPTGTKFMGELVPNVNVELNSDLDFLNLNVDDLCPAYYELDNECVVILDKDFTGNETIEVAKFKPIYKTPIGRKITGTVSPELNLNINPKLKDINFDFSELKIHYEDLDKEHIWMLDDSFLGDDDKELWAIKVKATGKTKGKIVVGTIAPDLLVETNPDLPELDFRVDYKIPWYDLKYEHLWILDPKHCKDAVEPIWAIKVTATDFSKGTKIIGNIEPYGTLIINDEVSLQFNMPETFVVQSYDFIYEHVWISEENNEKIWLAKLTYVDEPAGIKEINVTDKLNPETLDVIFLSYGEPNADENWERVKEKAPWAQRVNGVKGILEAHKAAANRARTDMFYVVDGDAFLFKKFNFNYKPSIFDRDCTYIWSAKNPLADLTYGHGGVKLFSKEKLLKLKKWRTLDMTTSVSEKVKVMSEISNWTAFNTDDFSTWKTAFRECVKLLFNVHRYPDNPEHEIRFQKWKNIDQSQPFGKTAVAAVVEAEKFVKDNKFDMSTLININNRDWLINLYHTTRDTHE